MAVKISAHALARAAERGITEEGILAILAERPRVIISSKHAADVGIVCGMYEGKIWGVVFNPYTLNVITVRRADKHEKRRYEQKKGIRPDVL
jgi:uncharacterized DUF497 family protein